MICETVVDSQEGLIKKKTPYFTELYQLMFDMAGLPEPVTG